MIQVKAIAGELPAVRAVPLGRWSLAELRDEVITTGLIDQISVSMLWRWLHEDALKPWRHRSWIFPRDPPLPPRLGWSSTCTSAGSRGGGWSPAGSSARPLRRLDPGPLPLPPHLAAGRARVMRVEHEYERGGALAYLAAWDVHRAGLFGRCEAWTGIAPSAGWSPRS